MSGGAARAGVPDPAARCRALDLPRFRPQGRANPYVAVLTASSHTLLQEEE